jgi:hypothetical protein
VGADHAPLASLRSLAAPRRATTTRRAVAEAFRHDATANGRVEAGRD